MWDINSAKCEEFLTISFSLNILHALHWIHRGFYLIQWLNLQPAEHKAKRINPQQPHQKSSRWNVSGQNVPTSMFVNGRCAAEPRRAEILSPGADIPVLKPSGPGSCLGTNKVCKGLWGKKYSSNRNTFPPRSAHMHKESYLSSQTIQGRSIAVNYCNSLFSSLSDHCRKGCLQNCSEGGCITDA